MRWSLGKWSSVCVIDAPNIEDQDLYVLACGGGDESEESLRIGGRGCGGGLAALVPS